MSGRILPLGGGLSITRCGLGSLVPGFQVHLDGRPGNFSGSELILEIFSCQMDEK